MTRILATLLFVTLFIHSASAKPMKALIIDGQNNHTVWPKSTLMLKQYLEETGLFEADIARVKYLWKSEPCQHYLPLAGIDGCEQVKKAQTDPDFKPDFSKYDVVVSNLGYGAADWPAETQAAFEKYMKEGGAFVSVHAADNSFPNWIEYNKMIGLGGWGGRTEASGPYVYWKDGEFVRDTSPGKGGTHGARWEFPVDTRNTDHPIMKDIPAYWVHTADELYGNLRGPAENMTILATALSKKTGKHEPILMTIDYHKGRIFHTVLGHDETALECVGFITTFTRGTEWAATGKVTIELPEDFPTADKTSSRPTKVPEPPKPAE
jgi:type 1 glutamine amidotransferase